MLKNLSILVVILNTAVCSLGCKPRKDALSTEKFTSKEATLAKMEFEGRLKVSIPDDYAKLSSKILTGELRPQIDSQLNDQLDFITGSLLNHKFFEGFPAAVYGKPTITILGVSASTDDPKSAVIRYKYTDNGAFNKKVVSSSPVTVPLVLPAQVKGFYRRAKVNERVVCVAGDHTDEEKFWYYWKIDAPGCILKTPDIVEISATLTPLPQTQRTYPWYNETFGSTGKQPKKDVLVTLIFGGDFEEDEREVLENLTKAGFKETEGGSKQSRIFRLEKNDYNVIVEQWVLEGGSTRFKEEAVKGLTKSDIFIYAGHSNYGGYFDPSVLGLTKQSFDQNKPQYFYFAGCRTFKYYNAKFFDLKPQKLNIVTTSVPSYGMTFPYTLPAFITNLTDERRLSWQEIIGAMQDAETESLTVNKPKGYQQAYVAWPKFKALLSVNGDEKNPTSPK